MLRQFCPATRVNVPEMIPHPFDPENTKTERLALIVSYTSHGRLWLTRCGMRQHPDPRLRRFPLAASSSRPPPGNSGRVTGDSEVMGKLSALCESLNLGSWDGSPSRSHAPCAGTRFRRRRHAGPPILHRSWTYASQEMAPHRARPGAAVAKSRSR
jgi:hypothetical protein